MNACVLKPKLPFVTEKDLDFITLYIQNMLPTFISNLKEELEK